jgi:hypothetical protein
MSLPDALSLLNMGMSLVVCGLAIWSVRHIESQRKALRVFVAMLMWYLFLLYLIAFTTTDVYLVRSGILTRVGVFLLLFAVAGDIIAGERHAARDH